MGQIYSITKGDPKNPAVLFLHGMLGASRNLFRLIDSTAQAGFFVLAYDQLGHGHSAHAQNTEDYALSHLAHLLAGVLDEHHVEKAHLVGHSMGARVCLAAAAQYPTRAKSLTMLDAGVTLSKGAESELTEILGPLEDSYSSKKEADEKLSHLPDTVKQFLLSNLRTQNDGRVKWVFDLHGIRGAFSSRLEADQTEDWKKIQCPALLVRGSRSDYLTLETQKRMLALNPHAQGAEVANAGHWLHVENFSDTFKTIIEFLKKGELK